MGPLTATFHEQIINQDLKQHVPEENTAGSEMHHKLEVNREAQCSPVQHVAARHQSLPQKAR